MKKLLININLYVKKIAIFVLATSLISCSSTKLITSWKNPDYYIFKPKKILVIGVTPNYELRKAFEFKLIRALNARKIKALQSAVVFETSFIDSKQTEKEIEDQVDILLSKGYDTILVSRVKGVDDNKAYSGNSPKTDYHLRRFILYYLAYQDAYFNEDYYNRYKVFNIETSIYNLKNDSDKSLVWKASFDVVDINNSNKVMGSYLKKLIRILEKDKIIPVNK